MDALASPTHARLRITRALIANKMWLVAGLAANHSSGEYKVRGFINNSVLASQAHWQKLSANERESLEIERLAACRTELETAIQAAATAVARYIDVCVAEGLISNLRSLRDRWASGELNLETVASSLEQSLTDLRTAKTKRDLAAKVAASLKLADYPETFPAYHRKRKLIAVLGPTNSGKTYDAFKRLATARAGAYLGPLRLLALEAFTRLNEEFGVVASLITGEERRIIAGSRVTASTIEMFDANKELEVAVIDEVQMLTDSDRGWAWTQAIVGANADEVWLLGALSAEPAIRALATRLGLPLEIRKKERKHPLVVALQSLAPHPNNSLSMAKPGDAFIVFSRRDALNLRDDLLAQRKSVACIYGALSPEVRESEARRFASGEADILVATDAIGMGLNLPIQRVVFTSVQKYNGVERGELPVPLLQQIGGRAGRYGHQASDEGVVVGLTPAEHNVVMRLMKAKQENLPTDGFMVAPGTAYLEQLAKMSGDTRLEGLLTLFMLHCDSGDRFFIPHVPEEQRVRAAQLDSLPNMPLPLKHIFSMAPMSSTDEDLDITWRTWARLANQGKVIRLNFLPDNPKTATLSEAETTVRLLAAYRWFGYRLPEIFIDYEDAETVLGPWITAVDDHLKSRRKQGVGGGRKGMPSWYWEPKRSTPRLGDKDLEPASMSRRRRAA